MRVERPKLNQYILKFGAGLNSRASEMDIDPAECADGSNFSLDIENSLFSRRKAFDLAGTATNAERINGFAQLVKIDGTISTLVQAGGTIYEWDGGSTFTSRGTVANGARMRGRLGHNFLLNEVVIITDLAEKQPVMTWDGTTFATLTHNLSGDFYARYVQIENERVYYGNVKSGTSTPHVIVASGRSDYDGLTVTNRPTSALSAADPFFLPTPDLRYINSLTTAFGILAVSTRDGRFFKISGNDATDMVISQLYADSAAAGEEAVAFVDNDIMYGRRGHLESLFATEKLGNVETDNVSRKIENLIENVQDWIVQYNPRTHKVFFIAPDQSKIYTLHKSFLDEAVQAVARRESPTGKSPWSVWTTQHASGFQPTASMMMKRPSDGLEFIYLGDNSGNIFYLEGASGQDGGTADIISQRLSGVIPSPEGGPVFDISGWITYRKIFPATCTITFEHGGMALFDQAITVTLDAASNLPVWGTGGGLYWSNSQYWSAPFKGRFTRQEITGAGRSSQVQVRVSVEGATDFYIQEIGIDFKTV